MFAAGFFLNVTQRRILSAILLAALQKGHRKVNQGSSR